MIDRPFPTGTDEDLLAALYRRHSAAVMAYALRRCGPDDAADVVSETFVVAWRRIGDVPVEPAARPWLFGVARRVLANQRRGFRRRAELTRKVAAHLTPAAQEIGAADRLGETEAIVGAMAQLSPADRELLMLSNWEELTPAEIAVTLGISGAKARKRLYRARRRLAATMGEAASGTDGGMEGPIEGEADTGEHRADSGHHLNNVTRLNAGTRAE